MNRTIRFAAIGLLCVGTSALSFGETFASLDSQDWGNTYNASTALFGAVIQQGGSSLESGFPTGTAKLGGTVVNGSEGFSLAYDPSTGLASLTVGSYSTGPVPTLEVAAAGGTLDHIGIALSTGSSDESITLSAIGLQSGSNTIPLTNDSVSSGAQPGLFDFALDPSTDLSDAQFTISGNISMTWNAGGASDPQLSAEIVGADKVSSTPEPGTLALLGAGLAGLGLLRRKRIV